jgi:putative oxidoreductase
MYEVGPDEFSEHWAPRVIAVLRTVTALLFFEHGTAKLLGFPATDYTYPAMWSLPWIAGVFELVGGFLLLIGLWTRWVALLLCGEMAVAYWYAHAPHSPFPIINNGEAAILYCFIFLTLFVVGAGDWSVDKALHRRKSPVEGYAAPGGERHLPEAADE